VMLIFFNKNNTNFMTFLNRNWEDAVKRGGADNPPRLLLVILKTFWKEFFVSGVVVFLNDIIIRFYNQYGCKLKH
jgi:hypothetical protein